MAAFKSDESFIEKISIGAIGTKKVYENLKEQNHNPIELERGSMSYKIWKKIKIKRIRVPDLLCVNNGIRIESRAKTKLEITMSHSTSDPERGWDSGMRHDDFVALVSCIKSGERPIDWQAGNNVQYVSINDLRTAENNNKVIFIKPKGAEEGFEARLTWPSAIASADGIIKNITRDRIQYIRNEDKRTISLSLKKNNIVLEPLVSIGENISNNQIIASVVPVYNKINSNPVNDNFYTTNLTSSSLSERYAAAKALSFFSTENVINLLSQKLLDKKEHIYVKLEVAASLAKMGIDTGYIFLKNSLLDNYLQNVLETVIILSEIRNNKSIQILCQVLDNEEHDAEIRAGAAWGLGEINSDDALGSLIGSFETINQNIRIEAARAILKLTDNNENVIINKFLNSNEKQIPGIAWALSKAKELNINSLLNNLTDFNTRQWVAYIIGFQGEKKFISEIENLKILDKEIYFAVTLLWKILTSWVNNLQEY